MRNGKTAGFLVYLTGYGQMNVQQFFIFQPRGGERGLDFGDQPSDIVVGYIKIGNDKALFEQAVARIVEHDEPIAQMREIDDEKDTVIGVDGVADMLITLLARGSIFTRNLEHALLLKLFHDFPHADVADAYPFRHFQAGERRVVQDRRDQPDIIFPDVIQFDSRLLSFHFSLCQRERLYLKALYPIAK